MRCDKTGKVYFHPKDKKRFVFKKKSDNTYYYYDIENHKKQSITKTELQELAISLPIECQQILLDAKTYGGHIFFSDQRKLLKLTSLSISIWGGSPKGKLPCTHINEYASEFYIQMVKFLTREGKSRFNPDRAKWPAFVGFIRMATINEIASSWEKLKPILDTYADVPNGIESIKDKGWEAIEENLALKT